MKVGFYLCGDYEFQFRIAKRLIASARTSLKDVDVIQFSDRETKLVDGVDGVIRLDADVFSRHRPKLFASVDGDWLFVDTDCVIEKDISGVFASDFDVAVTDREDKHLRPMDLMPYCAGVVFTKTSKFWSAVYRCVCEMSDDEYRRYSMVQPAEFQNSRFYATGWYADQRAICMAADSGIFKKIVLSGSQYQATSESHDAKIIHYKGYAGKKALLERIEKESL